MATVVEDRVLARIAFEAVAWSGGDPAHLAAVARGQAAMALRVLGIPATPEVARTVRDDIDALIADPHRLAAARSATARAGRLAA